MKNKAITIYHLLIAVTIFLTPFNLFYKLSIENAYVNGLLVDYLIPKIYISDVFIWAFILIWLASWIKNGLKNKRKQATKILKNKKITYFHIQLLLLPLILILNSIFSPNPTASIWYLFKLTELGIFTWLIFKTRQNLSQKKTTTIRSYVYTAILITLLTQSLLGLHQFQTQHALFDYNILGETNLNNFANITKSSFSWTGGEEKILPYGTTAHPNILGGILAVFWLSTFHFFTKTKKSLKKQVPAKKLHLFFWATTPLVFLTIYLTQSISAWLALGLGVSAIIWQKKLNSKMIIFSAITIFLVSPLIINFLARQNPKNLSLNRRNTLNQAAWRMWKNNPFMGIGLNNFTTQVEKYSLDKEVVRFVQPAHHIGLLWLAETGVVGGILVILGGWLGWKKLSVILISGKKNKKQFSILLLVLLPIATLDHYLLTQQSGLLLLVLAPLAKTYLIDN